MTTHKEKIEQFRQYIQDLSQKEIDDEYFEIDSWELEKTFERIFDEEDTHDNA